MMKKITKFLLFSALILFPFSALKAAGTKAAETIYIPKEEVISGNFYAAGQSITIDGNIGGDLIAAAQSIIVNGRVEGDIIAAAQDITVNGEVGGNIRIAGNSLNINGKVARNVNAFGSSIILGPESVVGWDVFAAGANITGRGMIAGSLSGYTSQALITGTIGKSVDLKLSNGKSEQLTVAAGAAINGSLSYRSNTEASISPDANIAGQINRTMPEIKKTNLFWPWAWARIIAIFAAIAVGLVLVGTCKKCLHKIITLSHKKSAKLLIPGIVIFFVIPPISLILLLTIIGIPLALILGAAWLIAAYIGKLISAIILGQMIIKSLSKKENISMTWSMVLGVIIAWLLFSVPVIGWLLGLLAVWFGVGCLWRYASNK